MLQKSFLFSWIILSSLCFKFQFSFAQTMDSYIEATTGKERLASYETIQNLRDTSLFNSIEFTNIGPFKIGGRVTDIEANPDNENYFYVATASGGVWLTEDNGKNYKPIFENQATLSVGDIWVDWKHNETIWVGTGEANSSRSSYPGTGIYRSLDKGLSWENMGLENTNHIARIVIHPDTPSIIWVAALGSLYSQNENRGIFKTINGGETWEKILYLNDTTGAIDLVINPQDPNTLYASFWHRQTRAWNRIEAGNTSGIYKTTDGGNSWKEISKKKNNFPQGEGIGRIGLAIYPKNPEIIYAFLDNQTVIKTEKTNFDKSNTLSLEDFKTMTKENFLQLSNKKIDNFLSKHSFSSQFTSEKLKKLVEQDSITPIDFYFHKTDTNIINDGQITGLQIYKSTNGGQKWKLMNKNMPLSFEFNYNFGYYFGQIRVSYFDENEIYVGGLYLYKSKNGGKTLNPVKDRNIHVDQHAIWLNPNKENHLIIGNDGGVNISYNKGKSWTLANNFPITQFYAISNDNLKPYNIYGGTQDNGTWYTSISDLNTNNQFNQLGGGDGMQTQIDTVDYQNFIFGYQYGKYFKTTIRKNSNKLNFLKTEEISTNLAINETQLRFGWQSPILLSKTEKNILYLGSNKLVKQDLSTRLTKLISPDLTNNGQKGCTTFGTIFSFSISKLDENLIYTGSDDGAIFRTENKGVIWEKINQTMPEKLKVTKIIASEHKKERVYASLSGYSFDNSNKFLYKSEDYGNHWVEIGNNLPNIAINCIYEDPKFENIIYLGTDFGIFISLNKGESFYSMHNNLPNVPVLDIKINPSENHLIVATHGRSLFVANLSDLYKINKELKD